MVRRLFMPKAVLFVAAHALVLFSTFLPATAFAEDAKQSDLAATPPMGWNSWDSYGTTVREEHVRANADAMARDLAQYGWQYIVVDIQWYEPNARGHNYKPGAALSMDEYGRLMPAVNRFQSAADGAGFKPLADYVHSKGLKFGIHIMRGIPRNAVEKNLPIKGTPYHAADIADKENACRWNPDMWGVDVTKPGAQAYYDSIAELYASWGVDFIKADDMGSHLYQPAEIKMLSAAIRKTGRPMVLSISPGPAPVSEVEFFQKYAHMWRISDDFWDDWRLLRRQFDFARDWAPFIAKNGTWPDADMLPLGKLRVTDKAGKGSPTKFTRDEQYTLMNLWAMFRSPLIFGGDLPSNDAFTTSLLTNPEVIAVNQASSNNREALARGNFVVWTADAPGSTDKYVAIFNLGEVAKTFSEGWRKVGVEADRVSARDLWQRKDLGIFGRIEVRLAPHASVLYRVSAAR
ncbi:MAG TPA: glycoside hydrolase family 27 protein [Terriglobales bacterium]|nr:glycoside hydrolase family 27 protein [Terriglobales bacterium]